MSLQDIIKKILADTQGDLQKIEADLADKKKALDEAYAEYEALDKKELEAKAKTALQLVDEKTASMARRENTKAIQQAKRELMDQALEKFLDSLINADEKLYNEICEKLIKALPFSSGTVTVPKARQAAMKPLLSGFDIETSQDFAGGFMVAHEGSVIDNSFENLVMSEYRSDLEMYLADQLKLV